jgi:hypothetical protein
MTRVRGSSALARDDGVKEERKATEEKPAGCRRYKR